MKFLVFNPGIWEEFSSTITVIIIFQCLITEKMFSVWCFFVCFGHYLVFGKAQWGKTQIAVDNTQIRGVQGCGPQEGNGRWGGFPIQLVSGT